MKTTLLKKAETSYFLLAAILLILLVSDSFGQNQKVADLTKTKNTLENLIMGIQSSNDGVRESSIYFAGKYRLVDTEQALVDQLKRESSSDIKVLIGLALFRMGSERGMLELKKLANNDSDVRVKRMGYAIYNEYLVKNSNRTAELNK